MWSRSGAPAIASSSGITTESRSSDGEAPGYDALDVDGRKIDVRKLLLNQRCEREPADERDERHQHEDQRRPIDEEPGDPLHRVSLGRSIARRRSPSCPFAITTWPGLSPDTIDVVPSEPSSLTCTSFATTSTSSSSASITVVCVSSRNAVVGIPTPCTGGSSADAVTGSPDCSRPSAFATNTFTVKFVEPGVTCPSTATTRPCVRAAVRPGDGQRDRRADRDRERVGARRVELRIHLIEPLQREDRARPRILAGIQIAVDDDAVDRRNDRRTRDLRLVLLHRRLRLRHRRMRGASIGRDADCTSDGLQPLILRAVDVLVEDCGPQVRLRVAQRRPIVQHRRSAADRTSAAADTPSAAARHRAAEFASSSASVCCACATAARCESTEFPLCPMFSVAV